MVLLASHLMSALAAPKLYLDPGSGSVLLQMILAALLGAGIVLRTQWSKIKSMFTGKDASEEDTDDDE